MMAFFCCYVLFVVSVSVIPTQGKAFTRHDLEQALKENDAADAKGEHI